MAVAWAPSARTVLIARSPALTVARAQTQAGAVKPFFWQCAVVSVLAACQSKDIRPAPQAQATASDAAVPTSTRVDAPLARGPRTACDTVAIQIDTGGAWLGAPPDVRCFAPRAGTDLDVGWLDAELKRLRAAIDSTRCPSRVELAVTADATYKEAIAAMDAATRAGFTAVSLVAPGALAMSFAGPPPTATTCGDTVDVGTPTGATAPGAVSASTRTHVSATTPIIVVTGDAITANRKQVATLAEASQSEGPIPALANAIGTAGGDRTIILQADAATSARVMNRVVETAGRAGFDEVIFAVKQPR